MRIVLAIDGSTQAIGFALFDYEREALLASGSINMKDKDTHNRNFDGAMMLNDELVKRRYIGGPKSYITDLVIEHSFFGKNPMTGKMISYGIGGLILWFKHRCGRYLTIRELNPCTAKNFMTGKGKADKEDMIRNVEMEFGLKNIDEHHADAVAIGAAFCRLDKSGFFEQLKEKKKQVRKKKAAKKKAKKEAEKSGVAPAPTARRAKPPKSKKKDKIKGQEELKL